MMVLFHRLRHYFTLFLAVLAQLFFDPAKARLPTFHSSQLVHKIPTVSSFVSSFGGTVL
jgi:hypothetical protein